MAAWPDKIKSNKDWCCLNAIAQLIDWAAERGKWPWHDYAYPNQHELEALFQQYLVWCNDFWKENW